MIHVCVYCGVQYYALVYVCCDPEPRVVHFIICVPLISHHSIADMAIFPWVYCCVKFYNNANEFLQMDSYTNMMAWLNRILERPATKRGIRVNGFGPDAVENRHEPSDFDAAPTKAE